MPRRARRSIGGAVYHVLNRGNSRRRLFRGERDYAAFMKVLLEATTRWPSVRVLALCLMPNHWHLVLRPTRDAELSDFMRWLTQTHTQRWRQATRSVGYGALYQGRFKSFIVEEDQLLLVLCRYVERNPLRARLVRRAETWRWSSASMRECSDEALRLLFSEWPIDRPANWLDLLNEPQDVREVEQIRLSVKRNRPLGSAPWVQRTVQRLGLEHTVRPPGRPRKVRWNRNSVGHANRSPRLA